MQSNSSNNSNSSSSNNGSNSARSARKGQSMEAQSMNEGAREYARKQLRRASMSNSSSSEYVEAQARWIADAMRSARSARRNARAAFLSSMRAADAAGISRRAAGARERAALALRSYAIACNAVRSLHAAKRQHSNMHTAMAEVAGNGALTFAEAREHAAVAAYSAKQVRAACNMAGHQLQIARKRSEACRAKSAGAQRAKQYSYAQQSRRAAGQAQGARTSFTVAAMCCRYAQDYAGINASRCSDAAAAALLLNADTKRAIAAGAAMQAKRRAKREREREQSGSSKQEQARLHASNAVRCTAVALEALSAFGVLVEGNVEADRALQLARNMICDAQSGALAAKGLLS